MRQWTVSSLAQPIAFRLFDAKPSPEKIMTNYRLKAIGIKIQWNLC